MKSFGSTPIITKFLYKLAQLTKLKLSILNGLVTVASFSMYSTPLSLFPLFLSSVAVSMSTQTLNQYIEVQFDRKMLRTCQRPLVLGMNPKIALFGGTILGAAGFYGLATYNMTTAAIGIAIWSSYLFVYTKLKTRTTANTFFGSVVGSMPVYLGWAASGRSICMIQPFAIFLYMMAWQHQHFFGIRWIYYDDYNNAGFQMEKSKKIAGAYIVLQTVLSIFLANYSIRYYGIWECYLLNIPLTLGLYYWGIKSAMNFSEGLLSARQLKIDSYKHFILFFGVFILCRIFGQSNAQNINVSKRNTLKAPQQDDLNLCL